MKSDHIYQQYLLASITPSDIFEHLELLYTLGKEVKNIKEFGVGFGNSTKAFLAAINETGGSLRSYEFKILDGVFPMFQEAQDVGLDAQLCIGDLRLQEIGECDLLLCDSHHTYEQVKAELKKMDGKVTKYILFHDTITFGLVGQDPGSTGIWPAINEFVVTHPEWKVKEERRNCNGMFVIERIVDENI